MTPEPMKILFLAAEAAPLVKVGGLGDVAGSLPPALRQLPPEVTGGRPLDVRVVIPFHGEVQQRLPAPEWVTNLLVERASGAVQARVFKVNAGGQVYYLISGPPIDQPLPVYSPDDRVNGEKYIFFSLAALELARQLNWQPDILHAHDWHTAIAVYRLCQNRLVDPFFQNTRSLLTIHNLPYLGGDATEILAEYGIPPTQNRSLPAWARSFPLPLGLLAADKISAVSPSYAREILTPEFGCGLQDFLATRQQDIHGILNGIDTAAWDPATDPGIPRPYSIDTLDLRRANKTTLQEELGLSVSDDPLLVFIGRMDNQKGVDLAIEGLRKALDLPWQAVFLGTGSALLESAARSMESEHPDRFRAVIRFDTALSRRLYAGGDMLLMPSRYEPCGLAQMIAMRYGCVPVARATGGLIDSIRDSRPGSPGTGFLFSDTSGGGLEAALNRAFQAYQNADAWQAIQKNGMEQDFSWTRSAIEYAKIYHQMSEDAS